MKIEEAKDIIFAQAECEAKEHNCDKSNCDNCQLLYMQGTYEEHIKALQMAIEALEMQIKMSEALERLKDISNKSMYDNLAIRILKEFLVS